jgi:DNA-binding beta-propeller fold protein YncE
MSLWFRWLLYACLFPAVNHGIQTTPLELVQIVKLRGPAGKRLDHLALDSKRGRLFVANMANASLDIIDLGAGKLLKSIPGQHGVQGVAYAPDVDRLFVGVGEDSVCNIFDGQAYQLVKSIKLPDADNVRYDPRSGRIFVAHAERALAVLDPKAMAVTAAIRVPGQPEAFQLEVGRPRLYLNVPSQHAVVVIDTDKNAVVRSYALKEAEQNYPMALDEPRHRLFIGCRKPATVVILDTETGQELRRLPIRGDVDDVFFDAKRKRLYASCGQGFLVVLVETRSNQFEVDKEIPTRRLARTCLLDSEAGRLYLPVPGLPGKQGPEIWIYRISP